MIYKSIKSVISVGFRRTVSFFLDLETKVAAALSPAEFDKFLLVRIRSFPYWSAGHMKLAERSLAQRNIARAYASAQAVIILNNPQSATVYRAKHLLGKCFLASGQPDQAMNQFLEIEGKLPRSYELQEDIAACHMAMENDPAALEILSKLPDGKISNEGRVARKALEIRLKNAPEQ